MFLMENVQSTKKFREVIFNVHYIEQIALLIPWHISFQPSEILKTISNF